MQRVSYVTKRKHELNEQLAADLTQIEFNYSTVEYICYNRYKIKCNNQILSRLFIDT